MPFHSVERTCPLASSTRPLQGWWKSLWKACARAVDKRCSSDHGATDDLHWLAAVPGDLELAEPGHPELGSALRADQEHLEVLDVLDVRLLLGGAGTRERPEHADPDPPD